MSVLAHPPAVRPAASDKLPSRQCRGSGYVSSIDLTTYRRAGSMSLHAHSPVDSVLPVLAGQLLEHLGEVAHAEDAVDAEEALRLVGREVWCKEAVCRALAAQILAGGTCRRCRRHRRCCHSPAGAVDAHHCSLPTARDPWTADAHQILCCNRTLIVKHQS